ncbi:myosin heavy chain, skeletal muscle-like [Impatiens glandulifera]|uniref:myosin heavy chain, skeletal muscle-like n=1 Tax=Impatiens glandulifera TaxID=253017 RepID=UPI001FB102A9|nr:myosin heavy chain, skeletal muscle-like [Impatiens glandulifera]
MASDSESILKSLNTLFLHESVEHRRQLDSLVNSKSCLESDLSRAQNVNAALVSELTRLHVLLSRSKSEGTDRKEARMELKVDRFIVEFEKKLEELRKMVVEAQMKDLKLKLALAEKLAEERELKLIQTIDSLLKSKASLETENSTLVLELTMLQADRISRLSQKTDLKEEEEEKKNAILYRKTDELKRVVDDLKLKLDQKEILVKEKECEFEKMETRMKEKQLLHQIRQLESNFADESDYSSMCMIGLWLAVLLITSI